MELEKQVTSSRTHTRKRILLAIMQPIYSLSSRNVRIIRTWMTSYNIAGRAAARVKRVTKGKSIKMKSKRAYML